MNQRSLVAILAVVLLAVMGLLAWVFLGGDPEPKNEGPGPVAPTPTVEDTETDGEPEPRKKKVVRRWVRKGTGTVVGYLLEYGSERPITDAEVTLEAGVPGPNEILRARTDADGHFVFEKVTNFEAWTLRAVAPPPLENLRLAGVDVVEQRETDLGRVYLAPGFVVPGRVVDEHGTPVSGALVRAVRSRRDAVGVDFLRLIREVPQEPPAVDSAETDAAGEFALTMVPPGRYEMIVTAAGYQMRTRRDVIITPESAERPLEFVLMRGFGLDGRVVRKGEGEIEGLRVVAFPQPNGLDGFFSMEKRFAETDEKGEFHIDGLGGGEYIVGVTPDNEPWPIKANVNIPGTDYVELVIEGTCWLEGKVTDSEGEPVSGAAIFVLDDVRGGNEPSVANVETDSGGRYRINGLKEGKLDALMVQAEGYSPYPADILSLFTGGGDVGITLVAGRNEHDITLEAGATVKGLILAKETEEPIQGARVSILAPFSFFGGTRTAVTGADGAFKLEAVPMGPGMLHVTKDGWYQKGASAQQLGMLFFQAQRGGGAKKDSGKTAAISVSEQGEVIERTLYLSPGSTVSGRVETPDGEPVPGAQVSLETSDSGFMGQIAGLFGGVEPRITDSEGKFEMPGPAPGQKVNVVAKAQGFLDGKSTELTAKTGETIEDVVVRMRTGATLTGTVKGADGKPLSGALVRWITQGENQWSVNWDLRRAQPHLTDDDGRFNVEHVEPGKVIVQVTAAGHVSESKKDVVAEDGKAITVDVALAGGVGLKGKVVGPDGRPRSGARIDVNLITDRPASDPYFEPPRRISTDSEGAFSMTGLPPGTYTLTASYDGTAPSLPVEAKAGGTPITLSLRQAFVVSGMVRTTTGDPVFGANVQVIRVDDQGNEQVEDSSETDATGAFEVEDIPPGDCRVKVTQGWGGGDRPNILEKVVEDVPAGRQGLVIEVESGLRIRGEVFLADGTPVPQGWVSGNRLDEEGNPTDQWQWCSITEGKFDLAGLKAGRYRLSVNTGDNMQRQMEAEAGNEDVRVDFAAGGTLRGRVTLPDGSPAVSAWVTASGEGGGGNSQTDENGAYELTIQAGTYKLSAYVEWNGKGCTATRDGVQVDDGADIPGMDLSLEAQGE